MGPSSSGVACRIEANGLHPALTMVAEPPALLQFSQSPAPVARSGRTFEKVVRQEGQGPG